MTRVVEDSEGQQLVREVEWDDDARIEMLALTAFEESLCPVCGGLVSECQAIENDGRFKADPPVRCHRTTAVLAAQEGEGDRKHERALIRTASLPD